MPTSKILLVGDDALTTSHLQRMLGDLGYEIVGSVTTGEEAVSKANETQPDLVLLDVALQGAMDGTEAAKQIWAQAHSPIVYIAERPDDDAIEQIQEMEPAGYLPKPVDKALLKITLHSALRTHKLQQDLQRSRQLLQSTFASLPYALFIIDAESTAIIDCNPAASEVFGYTEQEMLGRRTTFLYADEASRQEFGSRLFAAVEQQGYLHIPEFQMKRKDGTLFPTEHHVVPLNDEQGKQIGWVGLVRDITDRVEMADELSRSLERLDMATRSAGLGIWDWDIVRDELIWDDRMYELYGIRREDFHGAYEAWLSGVHPDDRAATHAASERARREGQGYNTQFRVVWPDGTVRMLRAHGRVVADRDGRPVRMIGVNYDITDQERASQALRDSEERYRTLFDQSAEGIYLHRRDGEILDVNEMACQQSGYSRDELLQLTIFDLHPDPRPSINLPKDEVLRLWHAWRADERVSVEVVHRNKDGTLMPVYITTGVVRIGQDDLMLAMVHDITDRKQAENALRESEERYRTVFENAPIAIMLVQEGKCTYANPTSARMLGYASPAALVGLDIMTTIAPEFHDIVLDRVRRLADEVSNPPLEMQLVRPDGSRIWSLSASISVHIQDKPTIVIMGQDVTALRQAQDELRHQERLAAVGKLAGGIAHDFNNLLATVVLYDHLALNRRSELPDSVVTALETILLETTRASTLVQQILDFSRRAVLDVGPLDLVRYVPQILRVLRPTLPESIQLSFATTCVQCTVRADPTRIEQTLINLAVNARDAMPDGGELRLSLTCLDVASDQHAPLPAITAGKWACIQVQDTGTGMSQEVQSHLFEPFFTTKPPGKGTGLGLSQVYGIVRQHDGHIKVESALGKGSTFSIYLPVVDEEDQGEDEGEADADTVPGTEFSKGRGELVLLVEDQPSLREAAEEFLISLGYQVIAAHDGREALQLAQEVHVDLLLTDVVMPNLGGRELLRRLRETRPELKAIAVTGHVFDQEDEILQTPAFDALLAKPFDLYELSSLLRSLLDRSEKSPDA